MVQASTICENELLGNLDENINSETLQNLFMTFGIAKKKNKY